MLYHLMFRFSLLLALTVSSVSSAQSFPNDPIYQPQSFVFEWSTPTTRTNGGELDSNDIDHYIFTYELLFECTEDSFNSNADIDWCQYYIDLGHAEYRHDRIFFTGFTRGTIGEFAVYGTSFISPPITVGLYEVTIKTVDTDGLISGPVAVLIDESAFDTRPSAPIFCASPLRN